MKAPDLQPSDTTGLAVIRRWQPQATILADLKQADGAWPDSAYLNISYGLAAQAHYPWVARIWEAQIPTGRSAIERLILSKNAITCLQDALELMDAMPDMIADYVLV